MRIHVFISGRVQGVFFRAHTAEKARQLGLVGWVRNTDDGRVEAVFEGPKEKVEEMIKWCWQGPPSSKVEKVSEVPEVSKEELEGFEIRY